MIKTRKKADVSKNESLSTIVRQIVNDSKVSDTPERRRQRLANYVKAMQQHV